MDRSSILQQSGNRIFRNPYEDKAVILAPISDEIMNDENLEPQMVRIRESNNSLISIDSDIRKKDTNPVDLTLGANNSVLFARKIKRFAIDYIAIVGLIPNVNPRNNVLTFEYNIPGNSSTVVLPEGLYMTEIQLLDELIVQLNTVTGATGLTFSYTQAADTAGNVIQPYCATLTAVGGTFRFFSDQVGQEFTSLMVERGRHLFNLSTSDVFSASKGIGQINKLYTRYIDVVSFSLNEYSKNPNANNTFGQNNQIFRIYLNYNNANEYIFFNVETLSWINYLASQTLTNIDIAFLDEYGESLYVPDCQPGSDTTKSNFSWMMELITQV